MSLKNFPREVRIQRAINDIPSIIVEGINLGIVDFDPSYTVKRKECYMCDYYDDEEYYPEILYRVKYKASYNEPGYAHICLNRLIERQEIISYIRIIEPNPNTEIAWYEAAFEELKEYEKGLK